MWIVTKTMNFIDNSELLEAGVDLENDKEIEDFFYENGAEETYHDHGISFISVFLANEGRCSDSKQISVPCLDIISKKLWVKLIAVFKRSP